MNALLYSLTILQAFPEQAWEFAPGVVCALDDFGDYPIYFDRRGWSFVDPALQAQSESMCSPDAYKPVLDRIGFLDSEHIGSLDEAFEFARVNTHSGTLVFYDQPRELPQFVPALTSGRNLPWAIQEFTDSVSALRQPAAVEMGVVG